MAETERFSGKSLPAIRIIGEECPWRWLSDGWADMRRVPEVSLAYGGVFVVASVILTLGLYAADLLHLLLPLASGFMFLGPLAAVGLYETSRRLERGEAVTLTDALFAWRGNFGQIAGMGLCLMLFILVWIRIATLIFALMFSGTPASLEALVVALLFTAEGLPMLFVGTAAGAALAALAFAMSAVALPLLLDRDVGVVEAIVVSVRAVARNWRVMTGWAALIVLFTAAGVVTFYIGLAITLPLIGHASWHAYRDLVAAES